MRTSKDLKWNFIPNHIRKIWHMLNLTMKVIQNRRDHMKAFNKLFYCKTEFDQSFCKQSLSDICDRCSTLLSVVDGFMVLFKLGKTNSESVGSFHIFGRQLTQAAFIILWNIIYIKKLLSVLKYKKKNMETWQFYVNICYINKNTC